LLVSSKIEENEGKGEVSSLCPGRTAAEDEEKV
jgi:hypothetical protein